MKVTSDADLKEFDVVVIGAVGVDTNIYLHGGEIDFGVEANFSENIDYVGQAGGYCSRNFAQLGYKTAFIGFVGDDKNGEFVRDELTNDGIECLLFMDHKGTKRSINFMSPDGTRKNFYDGKGSMETMPDLGACREILKKCKLAHFSIVNWARHLLPIAKELGVPISCDVQDIVDVNDQYRADFIKHSDILFLSAVNFSDPTPVINKCLADNEDRIVIVGMGNRGCATGTKNGTRFFDPVELTDPVVDTNGAGDGLAVGFLSSHLLESAPIDISILQGQVNARHICTLKGTTSDFMPCDQLEEQIEQI